MTQKGDPEQQRHRAGVFKQQNKTHKTGRHRSKGSLETANKGKITHIFSRICLKIFFLLHFNLFQDGCKKSALKEHNVK